MNARLQLAVVATLASGLYASAARADLLDWSYTYGNAAVISGVFTGTDAGNYFTVGGLQSFDVNGVASNYLAGALIESVDAFVGIGQGHNGNGTAVVTLDGSYLDLFDTPDAGRTGFAFIVGDAYSGTVGNLAPAYIPPLVSADDNPFVPARWSATLEGTPVPEPASAAIVLAGVLGLGIARVRKIV